MLMGASTPQHPSRVFALIMALLVGRAPNVPAFKEGLYTRDFLSRDHTETTAD